jgi:hypothetical protein
VYGIVDVVSRKWVASVLCAEATSVQVKVVFLAALEAEGCWRAWSGASIIPATSTSTTTPSRCCWR